MNQDDKYQKLLEFVKRIACYEYGIHVEPLPIDGEEARQLLKEIKE